MSAPEFLLDIAKAAAPPQIDGEWQYGCRTHDGETWEYWSERLARADAEQYGWSLVRRRIGDWQRVPDVEVTP